MKINAMNIKEAEEFMDKFAILSELNLGSIVELTNGDQAEFVKLNRKNFTANMNGTCYSIPVEMFSKIIKKKEENLGYMKLKKGDLFVINNNGYASVFKFIEMKSGKILATNPISNQKTRISPSFYYGKLSEIK